MMLNTLAESMNRFAHAQGGDRQLAYPKTPHLLVNFIFLKDNIYFLLFIGKKIIF